MAKQPIGLRNCLDVAAFLMGGRLARRREMDWNRIEGNWKQAQGKIKQKWGKLTDNDLAQINAKSLKV